ncbi:MAG TPA: type IV secretory system conjugative DNA transfer family protein, partial [Candidatus Acidoferrales bacterium]|nr:type IV secretory system conjugative DNA transfer family protein [Candidatus Acidoferrales bacterium]
MTASLVLGLTLLLVALAAQRWLGRSAAPDSHGSSRWAHRREWRLLGRRSSARRMAPDGIVLGWLGGKVLQGPREDNLLAFGVQRSGKTSTLVVPTLMAWRGAVVATSTKEELVTLTAQHRARLGPVWVFAPLDEDLGWAQRLGLRAATWNPVAEATGAAVAAELADLFTAEGKRGEALHWYLSASSLLTALLLKEHAEKGDLRSLLTRLNITPQSEYAGLAQEAKDHTSAELFLAYASTPDREGGSVASTARACLSLWIDERVARATRNGPDQLDVDLFLKEGGSLYLVAPAEDAERCRPLFTALIQTVLRRASARARKQGGVLEPRLLLALDELANFARIPRLAAYVSTGPGQGIQALLCLHDLAQLEDLYGREQARTVWNNCRARLLLPGQGDLGTLERFSRGIGQETHVFRTEHTGSG